MTARLRVEHSGPLTSVQDAGRPGWRRFGVPPSGPVDRLALAAANRALGNPPHAAGVELSHGGITLFCVDGALDVALTGDDFRAEVDGAAYGDWSIFPLHAGMQLRVRAGAGANWAYLAFAGDLDAPHWLGSRATHLLAGLGGGRVVAGASLTVDNPRSSRRSRRIPLPPATAPITVAHVVLGPQDRYFTPETLARLTAEPFTATTRFDRMGMALDGAALPPVRIDMPSEPAIRGALQVDGDGRIVLLTADHQTTGGYPRIAVVIDADVDRLMQLPAGSPVRFVPLTAAEAVARARTQARRREGYLRDVDASRADAPSLLTTNLIDGVIDALLE